MIEDEPFPLAISDSVPLRLGFWLERVGVTCLKWPSVPYRGIDRPPYLPSLEEEDELRSTGRRRLADLWDHYWDAEDSGELNINLRLAQDVERSSQFRRIFTNTPMGLCGQSFCSSSYRGYAGSIRTLQRGLRAFAG